jgi:deoxyribonuclease I
MQIISRLLFLLLLFTSYASFAELASKDYRVTRKIAQKIFADHRETLYCGCSYDPHGTINPTSCDLRPSKYSKRATRMEFEHMMPMENAGRHLDCWRNKICISKNGKRYRGRSCCQKISAEFRNMESELLNLWPSVGSINQARSNFRFTEFSEQEKAHLGKIDNCDFWLDKLPEK